MKGCIAEGTKIGKVHSMDYRKSFFSVDYSAFLNMLKPPKGGTFLKNQENIRIESAYISLLDRCSHNEVTSLTHEYIPKFVNTQIPLPIKIDYTNTLGSDRICSAVGAYKKFKKRSNILIIDFGTATTFNVVSKGVYKGGMISTGIKTSADALLTKTTLPKVSLIHKVKLINKDTENAIKSGLVFQQVFFVQKAIEEYKKLFKEMFVVATGGGMETMKKHVKYINKVEPNLVLEGLNHIGIYNETIRKK